MRLRYVVRVFPILEELDHPIGAHFTTDAWVPTGDTGTWTLTIPGATAPLVLNWREYRHERVGAAPIQCVGWYVFGDAPLSAKERYEYMSVTDDGTFRQRFRDPGDTGTCCTELVRHVQAGHSFEWQEIDTGAYKGMWRGDVHTRMEREDDTILVEETAFRLIVNVGRLSALVFRWRYIECA